MSDREFIVRTTRRVEIDADRIEEFVDANYSDEEVIVEHPETGRQVFKRGNVDEFRCLVCGEDAHSMGVWDGKYRWFHEGSVEPCQQPAEEVFA